MAHVSIFASPCSNLRLLLYAPPYFNLSASASNGRKGNKVFLHTWKGAIGREVRRFQLLQVGVVDQSADVGEGGPLDLKTEEFNRLQDVPREERDRIQRQQLIDRAAAAIAAARALISETRPQQLVGATESGSVGSDAQEKNGGVDAIGAQEKVPPIKKPVASDPVFGNTDNSGTNEVTVEGNDSLHSSATLKETPGPDFWSWAPPTQEENMTNVKSTEDIPALKPIKESGTYPHAQPAYLLLEKESPPDTFLPIPFETATSLPPLQSYLEVDTRFSNHAAEAASALNSSSKDFAHEGIGPDGSKWWRETGVEERSTGVVVKWTLTRGVTSDGTVEWEEKYWEASDKYDYKELGSEKSGRDARGNVWREFWKECMWQDITTGITHIEKTADKWAKNENKEEWQEKWWEQYDASGKADKWAHKWCSIDPSTPLDAGHAHVWHERWGENYDGQGGTTKYTDKWAERYEHGSGWSKWGDKWDERFNSIGAGLKQGETWWEGQNGEKWNRTWGEGHDGTGWVHKYGKSSDGEHWDTHVREETWYEGYPHYGFQNCYESSVQLRAVKRQL
ncbi:inactive purple acid phosphatase-like protein [Rhynchospora pubera]|uniref:Inactive purple acid phosphatase-like protein n=1 Tax=Rhynchospora pubera TaxID=906938 RepID=A0AAV8CKZ9_9POAL|nr:inactive purple acid phosphatase-like protein [Rhynchospora pubera]